MGTCEFCHKPVEVKTFTSGNGCNVGFRDVTICKECFVRDYYDYKDEWDKITLPTYLQRLKKQQEDKKYGVL